MEEGRHHWLYQNNTLGAFKRAGDTAWLVKCHEDLSESPDAMPPYLYLYPKSLKARQKNPENSRTS